MVLNLALNSMALGHDTTADEWDTDELQERLRYLTIICSPTLQFVSKLIVGCIGYAHVDQNEGMTIARNIGKLARLCSVECYIIGCESF